MSKTLVIVESFAKSKKIQQFLGDKYVVVPSFGHITNLDNEKHGRLGVDIQNNFQPIYTVIQEKRNLETVSKLKKMAKESSKILICSDPDNEGENIAYHIANLLQLPVSEKNRCSFNEITLSAIQDAIKNPRTINMNVVYSAQGRQVLDKVCGYDLSPVLWKHVAPKLSAGRVQSVALRMIVEKEKQVESFENSVAFKTSGIFQKNIHASLNASFENAEQAKAFLTTLLTQSHRFVVASIDKMKLSKKPPAPFITSTIQQEAGSRFKISAKKVMAVLQKLYQNGYITYMRTDSVVLSNDAIQNIKEYILDNYGADYHQARQYKNKGTNCQQGHEAIRPCYMDKSTIPEGDEIDKLDRKMYELIWKRTIASQMAECISEIHTMKIIIEKYDPYAFIAKCEQILFDGYRKVYDENYDGKKEKSDEDDQVMSEKSIFESLKVGSVVKMKSICCVERAAQPIPRYNEAFLVKQMERAGIGRPSTYASTIETLLERKYVEIRDIEGKKRKGLQLTIREKGTEIEEESIEIKIGEEKKKMVPTSIGRATCEFLEKHFPHIMDYQFTSHMEEKLDKVANGDHVWHQVVREYYDSFHPTVEKLLHREEAQKSRNERKRLLGKDGNGRNVYAYVAKYGSVFQVGEDGDKDKKFTKIESPHSVESVSIEDYLLLCKYPKLLGQYQEKDAFLKRGPYGFYISYDGKNYNAPHGEDTGIEEVAQIVQSKNESSTPTSTLIKELGKYMVKNGKYGAYVQYEKTIAKIPKHIVAADITKELCKELIDKAKSVSKDVKKKKQYFSSTNKKSESDSDS